MSNYDPTWNPSPSIMGFIPSNETRLEKEVDDLTKENKKLKAENKSLRAEVQRLKEERLYIRRMLLS